MNTFLFVFKLSGGNIIDTFPQNSYQIKLVGLGMGCSLVAEYLISMLKTLHCEYLKMF